MSAGRGHANAGPAAGAAACDAVGSHAACAITYHKLAVRAVPTDLQKQLLAERGASERGACGWLTRTMVGACALRRSAHAAGPAVHQPSDGARAVHPPSAANGTIRVTCGTIRAAIVTGRAYFTCKPGHCQHDSCARRTTRTACTRRLPAPRLLGTCCTGSARPRASRGRSSPDASHATLRRTLRRRARFFLVPRCPTTPRRGPSLPEGLSLSCQ